ncbi:MAG: phosphoribosylformylglycinamidine synthase subunit PurQ [Thermoguttaceae bacterium]
MKPRILLLRAPGTNCDVETAFAFERAGGDATVLHVNRLVENRRLLADFQILCIPGGFSFGDDVASGKVFASTLRHVLADATHEFRSRDTLILGICNGFQTLLKSGILLGDAEGSPPVTLTWNRSGMYRDTWLDLEVRRTPCHFLTGIEKLTLPVAHAEGRFVAEDDATLDRLESLGCVALCYSGTSPNGSQRNIAGVCDATGRVFGLMPHPERFIDPTHHPRWTRGEVTTSHGDGFAIFQNAVRYFG